VLASAYAVTDEFHQTFVEGRHGTPVDWLIDSAGAGLVALRLGRAGTRTTA
jgi:VanZ family protein